MKRFRRFSLPLMVAYCIGLIVLATGAARAQAMRVEAQLIWASDDPVSPNPKYRPAEADIARRFVGGPFRWKYYYEVNRQAVALATGEGKPHITMSQHCVLDVKNLGANRVQVKLYGDGKLVSTHSESLAKNHMLVLSGDAGNHTAWLVAIRQRPEGLASTNSGH